MSSKSVTATKKKISCVKLALHTLILGIAVEIESLKEIKVMV